MVGICVQELTDAYFEFEEEKARWASLEDNHDGECQRLGQEITKLHNQLEQVDYPDLFCIGSLCLPFSSADNICHEILTHSLICISSNNLMKMKLLRKTVY